MWCSQSRAFVELSNHPTGYGSLCTAWGCSISTCCRINRITLQCSESSQLKH